MAIRRLVRIRQLGGNTAGGQSTNWSTQATETYDANSPAASPSSWGTTPELANLDRKLTATGSTKQHLGLLGTFSPVIPDDFWGALVKVIPTFATDELPSLELWTKDATSSVWTKRDDVNIALTCRTGEARIYDLLLDSPLTNVRAVWITMQPDGASALNWVCAHLYGDCAETLEIPDCPTFDQCAPSCDVILPDWVCNPDQDPAPPPTFTFPPVPVKIPSPTYDFGPLHGAIQFLNNCPGPNVIRMYFGEIPTGGSVRVTYLNNILGLRFTDGFFGAGSDVVTQTISAPGTMDWRVKAGTGYYRADPALGGTPDFLWPDALFPTVDFLFEPLGATSAFQLLDILQWFWTAAVLKIEVC